MDWKEKNRFQAIHILPEISYKAVTNYLNESMPHELKTSEFRFECLICTSSLLNKLSNINEHLKQPSHIGIIKKDCKQFTAFCILCRYIFIADNPDTIFQHFTLHGKVDEQGVQESLNNSPARDNPRIFSSSTLYKGNKNIHADSINQKSVVVNEKKCLNNGNLHYSIYNSVSFKSFYPKEAFFSNKTLQFISPGVTEEEFTISRKLNNSSIHQYCRETYYSEYYPFTKIYFSCLECKQCRLKEGSFYTHLSEVKHYENLGDNYSSCFIKICDICQVLLLGRLDLIKGHFKSKPHLHQKKPRMKRLKDQYNAMSGDQKLGYSGLLTGSCTSFFSSQETLNNWVESSLKEAREVASLTDSLKRILERDFSKTLEEKYTDFNVEVFGSRLYGLADLQSDLDIYLDIGKASVCDLAKYFRKAADLFEVMRIIPDAKVPLLRLKHLRSNLICDINTTESVGGYCSRLIKLFISLDERVHWVAMAVLKWSAENNIRGFRKFKNYALICLIMCFLMTPGIRLIPSVNELKSLYEGSTLIVKGWDYSFCGDIKKIKSKHNPLLCKLNKNELLAEFFKFCSDHDAKNSVIFPYSGEVYNKNKFTIPSVLLPAFKIGQKYPKKGLRHPFVISDFFNLTENVNKGVDENLSDHFKSICHETLLCGWRNKHS